MAWIESHQSLARHRKTLRAAALLKVDRHKLIGHLHELWWWALDNVPANGSLAGLSEDEIGESAGWAKGHHAFVQALVEAGFIDQGSDGLALHDWYDYAGKLAEQRAAERERSRRRRGPSIEKEPDRPAVNRRTTAGQPPDRPPDDRQTTAGTQPNRTQPNPTVPNQEDEHVAPATPPAESGNGRNSGSAKSRSLSPLADAFVAVGLTFPDVLGSEINAAQTLMKHYAPTDIAECWRDVQQNGRYDDFDRKKLSFGYLSRDNRLGNWQRWRDDGKPAEARSNGGTYGHHRGSSQASGAQTKPGEYAALQQRAHAPRNESPGAVVLPADDRIGSGSHRAS